MNAHTPYPHAMDGQEKANFLRFIRILADTGNIHHAITESGWTDTRQPDRPHQTLDPSTIPADQLHLHTGTSVTLPPPIAAYIQDTDDPLTTQERHSIADALEKHHRLPDGFCIIDTPDGDFYLEIDHD